MFVCMSEKSGKSVTDQLAKEAWIGDAVLCLYAREKILRESGQLDGAKCVRMTSNQFLSAVGEPTKVEAAIGRVYEQQGLAAAFAWIEEKLMPVFGRQEENREKKLPGRKRPMPMKD
jgi:dsRNA-specific ribonuclease